MRNITHRRKNFIQKGRRGDPTMSNPHSKALLLALSLCDREKTINDIIIIPRKRENRRKLSIERNRQRTGRPDESTQTDCPLASPDTNHYYGEKHLDPIIYYDYNDNQTDYL